MKKPKLDDREVKALRDEWAKARPAAVRYIRSVFWELGWTWHEEKLPPSAAEIRDSLDRLVESALMERTTVSSGRLQVDVYCDEATGWQMDVEIVDTVVICQPR